MKTFFCASQFILLYIIFLCIYILISTQYLSAIQASGFQLKIMNNSITINIFSYQFISKYMNLYYLKLPILPQLQHLSTVPGETHEIVVAISIHVPNQTIVNTFRCNHFLVKSHIVSTIQIYIYRII